MSASGKHDRPPVDTQARDARGKGRELAMLALCHLESYPPDEHEEALSLLWKHPPRGDGERGVAFATMVAHESARSRADALARALVARWTEVDDAITRTSLRWRMERMAQVDRNVLRVVAFELDQRPSTPRPVVLAEAVRLARRYGSERSPGFVNGVAEALAKRLRPGGDG